MRLIWRLGLVAIVSMCLAALAISAYPGMVRNVVLKLIPVSIIVVPLGGIVCALVVVACARSGRLVSVGIPKVHLFVGLVTVGATFLLIAIRAPEKLAFAVSRSEFDDLVSEIKPSSSFVPIYRWVGLFYVDRGEVDPRGGWFFRVNTAPTGYGPDQFSYGAVYKPNALGTPFGSEHYSLRRIEGEWYWFKSCFDR